MSEVSPARASFAAKLFGEPEIVQPIIADRSTVQVYADCPHQGNLRSQHPEIDTNSKLSDAGTVVHALIQEAFEFCEGDLEGLPDYFLNELPKTNRTDIQPEIIRAARYVADELANMPLNRVLGVEKQINFPEQLADGSVKDCPNWLLSPKGKPMVLTTRLDLLAEGSNKSLIVTDWKSGYKKRSDQDAFDDFQTQFCAFILWQLYPDVETIHWFYKETRWGSKAYARLDRSAEHPRQPHLTTEAAFQARIMTACTHWLFNSDQAFPLLDKCILCPVVKFCKHCHTQAIECTTDEQAFVDQMCVISTRLEQMEDAAKAFIKSAGRPLKGTKMEYDWKPPAQKFTPKLHVIDDSDDKPKRGKKKETKPAPTEATETKPAETPTKKGKKKLL
jgi:hypothetical protein